MIVTDIVHDPPYPGCITGPENESGSPRSQGTLHLSTIYRDLEESALLQAKGDATPEELAWYGAGGYLWERVFSRAHWEAIEGGDLVRPEEFELDGIVGSPDGIRVSAWRIIETKFRWMSSNKFDQLEKFFWVELVQLKGYCKLIGTDEAELHVFFCNGDYRPPRPIVKSKLIQFTGQEIDESWQMIVRHAQRRGWL